MFSAFKLTTFVLALTASASAQAIAAQVAAIRQAATEVDTLQLLNNTDVSITLVSTSFCADIYSNIFSSYLILTTRPRVVLTLELVDTLFKQGQITSQPSSEKILPWVSYFFFSLSLHISINICSDRLSRPMRSKLTPYTPSCDRDKLLRQQHSSRRCPCREWCTFCRCGDQTRYSSSIWSRCHPLRNEPDLRARNVRRRFQWWRSRCQSDRTTL